MQRDLKIHPSRTNSGAEEREKKISPSAFCFGGAAQGEPSPELSSYPFIFMERRGIVIPKEMNGIYQVFYPGYSIDLYLLYKGEKTWIAV